MRPARTAPRCAPTTAARTWTELVTGTDDAFWRVQAVTRDTVVLFGGRVVLISDDAGETFRTIAAGDITALSFSDPANGYLFVRGGAPLRTTDGGRTLTPVTALPDSDPLVPSPGDAVFTSADAGVVFRDGYPGGYRTSDGGRTWTRLTGIALGNVERIDLVDGALWAAGGSTVARRTSTAASRGRRPR